jgi:hypothetical protein
MAVATFVLILIGCRLLYISVSAFFTGLPGILARQKMRTGYLPSHFKKA